MLNELKQLLQSLHEKLDLLLAKEQPAVNQFVQLADSEVEKIVEAVTVRLTGEAVNPPEPSQVPEPPESEAQQIEVQ